MQPIRQAAPVPCEHCHNPDKALWQTECRYEPPVLIPPCEQDDYRAATRRAERSQHWAFFWALFVPAVIVILLACIGRAHSEPVIPKSTDMRTWTWRAPDGVNTCTVFQSGGLGAVSCTTIAVTPPGACVLGAPPCVTTGKPCDLHRGIADPHRADQELSDANPCKPKDDLE